MINYIQKDVTTVDDGIVAHGCNCQGVMGSGVALAIRNKWPKAYETYNAICVSYSKTHELLGDVHFVVVEMDAAGVPTVIVANCFTQHLFGRDKVHADVDAVEGSLTQAFTLASGANMPLYMPRIGCGLGGLNWDTQVGPVVEKLSEKFSTVEVNVCDL